MGNEISRPVPKERPLAFARRKIGLMTRTDKINRLVRLTLLDDKVKLTKFAAKANFTANELRTYYEKVKAILSEFCTDVPDIEYMIETLAYENDDTSSNRTTGSSASSNSLLSPIYQDPGVQKEFEQFCLERYGKKMNFKRNKCAEAGEGGSSKANERHGNCSPRQVVIVKPTNGCDDKSVIQTILPPPPHTEALKIPGYANPTRQPVATHANSKKQTKPVSDTWTMQIPVFPGLSRQTVMNTPGQPLTKANLQGSDNKDDPDFNNPTQQHRVFSPVPRLQLPISPDDDQMSVLGHPPLGKSIKEELLNDGNMSSHLQQFINKEVTSAPVFPNQTRQPGSNSMKCETMKKPDVNPELMDVPVITCPSRQNNVPQEATVFAIPTRQPVVSSPVKRKTQGEPDFNTESQEVTAFANPTRQPMTFSHVMRQAQVGPDINTESQIVTAFANPTRQPVRNNSAKDNAIKKPAANPASEEVPVFKSPSRQPVLFSPVMHQAQREPVFNTESQEVTAFANPTRQPMTFSPVIHQAQGESVFNTESQEVTAFANPTRQPVGNNSVKYKTGKKPAANPESDEVPVFKSPSRQPVVCSPVMRQAQDGKTPMNAETHEVPVFANPTRQQVVFSPVMRQAQGAPDINTESQEATEFANPTRQPVGNNSAKYKTLKKPASNTASEEVPVFKSPSRQPVLFSPVMRQAQGALDFNTELQEATAFANPTRQPVESVSVKSEAMRKPVVNQDLMEVPVFKSPSRQPVVFSPVMRQTIIKHDFNAEGHEVPMVISPSRQPVVFSPVMGQSIRRPDLEPEAQEVTMFANPTRPHLNTPQNEMALSIVGDHSSANPNEHPESHSPVKSQSRMLGKINKGLLTRNNVTTKHKVPSKKSNVLENRISKSTKQTMEVKVGSTTSRELNGNQEKSDSRKPNVMRKCIDKLNGKKGSDHAKRPNEIKVKPASPGCPARNNKKFLTQKPVLSQRAKKRVISQTNLRPDKGIVWPTELDGLSSLNKAYYVEQFLRTELFKQRCKRREKGGSVWMNGLSKFQLWVIENQGTDAIDAVLDTVPKNKTDAVAKVQCWRSDSPDC